MTSSLAQCAGALPSHRNTKLLGSGSRLRCVVMEGIADTRDSCLPCREQRCVVSSSSLFLPVLVGTRVPSKCPDIDNSAIGKDASRQLMAPLAQVMSPEMAARPLLSQHCGVFWAGFYGGVILAANG